MTGARILGGVRRLLGPLPSGAGPRIAWLVHRGLGAVLLVAFLSLGSQVQLLMGPHGLEPAAALMARARAIPGVGFFDLPTWMWLVRPTPAVLWVGIAVGAGLSVLAILGVRPRTALVAGAFVYLGFANGGGTFFGFQWDYLVVESCVVSALVPEDREAPWRHLVLRLLLAKLYLESGLSKWHSPIGDWRDGSAMGFYYWTAPLPTWVAFYMHHLPAWWHAFESRATLVLEILGPLCFFGPRRMRLAAFFSLTGLQVLNLATASYGFFVLNTLVLHLELLDDADLRWVARRLRVPRALLTLVLPTVRSDPREVAPPPRWLPSFLTGPWRSPWVRWLRPWVPGALAGLWILASLPGLAREAGHPVPVFEGLARVASRLHVASTYHLFAAVTRDRIEPEVEVETPAGWRRLDLWHKPGDPKRRPDFAWPNQPRVDFQMWFYGLGFRRGMPAWVHTLLVRLCRSPATVAPLFREPLPAHPLAVRMAFARYRFTSAAEKAATGDWWRTTFIGATTPMACGPAPAPAAAHAASRSAPPPRAR